MRSVLDFDEEAPRLTRISLAVTAALPPGKGLAKAHSESRIRAIVLLDVARIRRERADGTLRKEGRTVWLGPAHSISRDPLRPGQPLTQEQDKSVDQDVARSEPLSG